MTRGCDNARTSRRPASGRGYILLVTLGLLVLSTTLLVAVGRAAVRHATQARFDQQQLQRKWGLSSVRAATLPFSESILTWTEAARHAPVPSLRADIVLGGDTFSVVVSDEQAKADVNEMLQRFSPTSVEARLVQGLSGTPMYGHVRLRPGDASPRVTGFGQVFDDVSPGPVLSAAKDLTLWGDGGLNLMRADEPALRMSLAPSLSQLQISRLVQVRNQTLASPGTGRPAAANTTTPPARAAAGAVQQVLDAAKISPRDRARLPLVARSTCHSVLLILNDGRRLWYDLTVSDESDPAGKKTASVVW